MSFGTPRVEGRSVPDRSRGFTLIELSVVILILALLSASVVPRLIALRQGDEVRKFRSDLATSVVDARSRAMQSNQTISLSFEESERRFQLTNASDDDADRALESITLPSGLEIQALRLRSTETPAGDWTLNFYADGSCDGGGIEVSLDGRIVSLSVSQTGAPRWLEDELPEAEQDRWQAGELEVRGG